MRLLITAATLMIGLAPVGLAQSKDSLHEAYEKNRVFTLRDILAGTPKAPPFYRGALAAAANQISTAEKELRSVTNSAPSSDQAYESHDLLGNLYFRNGMYRSSFRELQAALEQRPDASDAKQMLPIAAALNNLPEMKVVSFRPSELQIEPKSIFLPIQLNGHDAEFLADTAAGISIIGEAEAKELGVPTQAVEGRMGDASGRGVSGLQIAYAKDLIIGGLHLQNVPFIVISDTGAPWDTLPVKRHGIIGISVLLAMKTIRWRPEGSFEFGFHGSTLNLSTCNVLFHNSNPVVDVRASGKHLDFTLDTGAVTTDLNPAFAEALPALVKTGTRETQSIEGLGGVTEGKSVLLPSVTLQIGEGVAYLKPAHVFTEHGNGSWAAGNLGMDILSQATAFTLDFGAMTLQLQ